MDVREQDEQSPPVQGAPVSKPKARPDHHMKRVSRACLHCRQRKSKCDLYVSLDQNPVGSHRLGTDYYV